MSLGFNLLAFGNGAFRSHILLLLLLLLLLLMLLLLLLTLLLLLMLLLSNPNKQLIKACLEASNHRNDKQV